MSGNKSSGNHSGIFLILLLFGSLASTSIMAVSLTINSDNLAIDQIKNVSNNITYIGRNLAPIPGTWGSYNTLGDVCFARGAQITHLDNIVLHNRHPSIRLDFHTDADPNIFREVDNVWTNVSPGDHIYVEVWIKTGSSSAGEGARLGFDFYPPNNYVNLIRPLDSRYLDGLPSSGGSGNYFSGTPLYASSWTSTTGIAMGTNVQFVPWGSDWTLQTYDFYIPTKTFTSNYEGKMTPTQIGVLVPWLDARPITENTSVWFADYVLFINPKVSGV